MGIRARGAAIAAVVLCAALALGGCTTRSTDPSLSVTPTRSGMDARLSVVASGLSPGQSVAISVGSTDSERIHWSSRAVFVANGHGVVDPNSSAARSGSYTGVDPMGLVTSMRPPAADPDAQYRWRIGASEFRFTLQVDGRVVDSRTVDRTAVAPSTTTSSLTLQHEGFIGTYTATSANQLGPAALLIGGSEGGNSGTLVEARLAAHGIRTLSVAYFGEPGLPTTLSAIPLEYFATALAWLRRQPGVDPDHVWVIGGSRGSEAAMLLAVDYPNLVNGVVVNAPGSVAFCSYPYCDGPAWTLKGRAIPYTRQFNTTAPTDDPAAVIPVDRIAGPILAVCGTADIVWDSCTYGSSVMTRLKNDDHVHTLLTYSGAGHLGGVLPDQPAYPNVRSDGGSMVANDKAMSDAWSKELAFIQGNSS